MDQLAGWIIFGPAKLLGLHAWAGLVIAVILLGSQGFVRWQTRKREHKHWPFMRSAPVFAAVLWVFFTLYEWQMQSLGSSNLSNGSSFFRLDLLVWTPVLYLFSGLSLLSLVRESQNNNATRTKDGDKNGAN